MRNTQTFQSVPSYLIISSIYLCSPSSLSQISAKLRKLHKKNWLTFSSCKLHSTAILFVRLLTFSYESFSVFLNEAEENQIINRTPKKIREMSTEKLSSNSSRKTCNNAKNHSVAMYLFATNPYILK